MNNQQDPTLALPVDVTQHPNAGNPQVNPYLKGQLDTDDVLKAKLDPDFYEGYCIGTIHKRLHEATSIYRNDPQGRLRKYQSVLFYAQRLFQAVAQSQQTHSGFLDLANRFPNLNLGGNQGGVGNNQSNQNQQPPTPAPSNLPRSMAPARV